MKMQTAQTLMAPSIVAVILDFLEMEVHAQVPKNEKVYDEMWVWNWCLSVKVCKYSAHRLVVVSCLDIDECEDDSGHNCDVNAKFFKHCWFQGCGEGGGGGGRDEVWDW